MTSFYTPIANIAGIIQKSRDFASTNPLKSINHRISILKELTSFFSKEEANIYAALNVDLGRCNHESYMLEISQINAELTVAINNVAEWAKPKKIRTGFELLHMMDGLEVRQDPLGLVCVISPWNYPLSLCFIPVIGAIAAGNVVVIKPSNISKSLSTFLAEKLPQYTSLKDYISVINGGRNEISELLKYKFDHIFFTGNGSVGRLVMEAASKHLTPVTLELGGKSPTIVHESCRDYIENVANRILWGKFINCGQTCVAPDYVLVQKSVEAELLRALKVARDKFFEIDGSQSSVVTEPETSPIYKAMKESKSYSRIVSDSHFKRLLGLLTPESGNIVFGGENDPAARFLAPTVLTNVKVDGPVMSEEIFGPVLPVIPFDKTEDVYEFLNKRDKPLALYCFSYSDSFTNEILDNTTSGGVTVNDVIIHVGSTHLPFGGVGESGMGQYHGKFTFDALSHSKCILKKSINGKLNECLNGRVRYPPYTEGKTNKLKKII